MSDTHRVRVHHESIEGPAPPVVLLHGVTDSLESYRPAMAALAGTVRTFVVDLRGHGRSPHAPGRYRIADHAGDVCDFVGRVVREPVVLAGHSLGGLVTTYVAAHMPELVRGAFLEDPPLYTAQMPALGGRPEHAMFGALRALLRPRCGVAQSADDLVPLVGSWPIHPLLFAGRPLLEVAGPEAVADRALALHRMDVGALDAVLDGTQFDGFDVDAALAAIRVPVHLLAGDVRVGGAIESEDVRRVGTLVRRYTHRTLPGVGHLIHHTATSEYVQELRAFVAACR